MLHQPLSQHSSRDPGASSSLWPPLHREQTGWQRLGQCRLELALPVEHPTSLCAAGGVFCVSGDSFPEKHCFPFSPSEVFIDGNPKEPIPRTGVDWGNAKGLGRAELSLKCLNKAE